MLCEVLSPPRNHYKCFKVKTFTNFIQKFKRELKDTKSEACWLKFKPFANKGASVILATKTAQCVHVECFDDPCKCIFKGQTINSLKIYKNLCAVEMFTCFVSLGEVVHLIFDIKNRKWRNSYKNTTKSLVLINIISLEQMHFRITSHY